MVAALSINTGGTQPPSLIPLPLEKRQSFTFSKSHTTTGQGNRCPGAMERGALWDPYPGMGPKYCSPSNHPTGP